MDNSTTNTPDEFIIFPATTQFDQVLPTLDEQTGNLKGSFAYSEEMKNFSIPVSNEIYWHIKTFLSQPNYRLLDTKLESYKTQLNLTEPEQFGFFFKVIETIFGYNSKVSAPFYQHLINKYGYIEEAIKNDNYPLIMDLLKTKDKHCLDGLAGADNFIAGQISATDFAELNAQDPTTFVQKKQAYKDNMSKLQAGKDFAEHYFDTMNDTLQELGWL